MIIEPTTIICTITSIIINISEYIIIYINAKKEKLKDPKTNLSYELYL